MKRRFGMWMAMICILIVGISVTRMTREFVISQGVETAAIVSVMDAGKPKSAVTDEGNAAAGSLMNPVKRILDGSENGQTAAPGAVEHAEGYGSDPDTNTDRRGAFEESAVISEEGIATEETAAITIEGYAQAAEPASGAEQKSTSGAAVECAPMADSVTDPASALSGEEPQETVKSPLDPVVMTEEKSDESEKENVRYSAEDFFVRFETAESNAEKIWENISSDNIGAYYAAAEQERVLWDYELNLAYNIIRGRLSDEEAENLKILELEWIKERDLYAERAAAKSGKMSSQNQNSDYTRALADKTKERCYWLISEYEDLLNGEDSVTKQK